MMDFLSDDIRRDPYPLYARLRQASPLLHEPRLDAWMVFDYDGVRRTLHDPDTFSSSPLVSGRTAPDWFIFADPPRHTRM
ncbi:MAG TPA: hypothetical protein VEQ60_32475, partial [Longimicrobium sp.]|nr:hypothetical protein [Longimicrobium sp.]